MSPRTNSLLSNLPQTEYEAFAAQLQRVMLHKGQVLFEAGEVPRHVYFPVGAVVSMMSDTMEGDGMETHMFGKTCMVGVATVGRPSFYRALVRGSGPAYRMPVAALVQMRSQCPCYGQNVGLALNRLVAQLSQTMVCCRHHSVEQQLIRWILISLDRAVDHHIQTTHRELSDILGVRREAVTLNLKKMADRGEVALGRGAMEVLDRGALEARSCECYWVGQERTRPTAVALAQA